MRMKTVLSLVLVAAVSFAARAHEYFFAFAEMDYNAASRCFEITLQGSAHDVEDVLNETGIEIKELEDYTTDKAMLAKLEGFINGGFTITSGGVTPHLILSGYEVLPTGLVSFYLVSDAVDLNESVDIQFDWLMDALPKQQNKITLRYENQNYTAVFMPQQRRATIKFASK